MKKSKIIPINIPISYIGIYASSSNGVIGSNNTIPWELPEDIKFFKKITLNNIVIMGRKTFESLPYNVRFGLPNRINIILSNNIDKEKNSTITNNFELETGNNTKIIFTNTHNLQSVLNNIYLFINNKNKKIFIIGGATIYNYFTSKIDTWYITEVKKDYLGEIKFKPYDLNEFTKTEDIMNFYSTKENCRVSISKWNRNMNMNITDMDFLPIEQKK